MRTNGRKTKCAEKTPMRIAWGVLVRGQDFEANFNGNTVSVIATAMNTVTAVINDRSFNGPDGVAVTPDGSKGLCRELRRQHHVGHRHGDEYGDHDHRPQLQRGCRRGGDSGRPQGLCRELFRQHGVGDRYRDRYAGLNGAATLQHILDHASE